MTTSIAQLIAYQQHSTTTKAIAAVSIRHRIHREVQKVLAG